MGFIFSLELVRTFVMIWYDSDGNAPPESG